MGDWPIRDILFLVAIVFNAGGLVWMVCNHMKHVNDHLSKIWERLEDIQQRLARIEGRLNSSHQ